MGDNFKTALKMRNIVRNIRIFKGRYNAIAPLLIHMCFICVFWPARSVKWDTCTQVRSRHNSTTATLLVHFSFQRQIVMLAGIFDLRQLEFLIFCNYCWESNWKLFVKNAKCSLSVFFRDGKLLLEAVVQNFELVRILFGTLGALSFYFAMENSCLGQV